MLYTPPARRPNQSGSAALPRGAGSPLSRCTMSDSRKQEAGSSFSLSAIFIYNSDSTTRAFRPQEEEEEGGKENGSVTHSDSLQLELVVERFEGRAVLVRWTEVGRENTL